MQFTLTQKNMDVIRQILLNLPQGVISALLLNGTVITIVYLLYGKNLKNDYKTGEYKLKNG